MRSREIVLYDPQRAPIRGMRSAVAASLLGAGEWQLLQNVRWDKGALDVRAGTSVYLDVPTAGATPIDFWSGELNGTTYLIGAFKVGSEVRVYRSTGGAAWVEVTGTATWSGATEGSFTATQGITRLRGTTDRVTFTPIRTAKSQFPLSSDPTTEPSGSSVDVLLIQNGDDYPRVWDPTVNASLVPDVCVHRPVKVPRQAAQFRQIASFGSFFQVAGSTKTFSISGGANGANFLMGATTVAPYTGTNQCIEWKVTSSAAAASVATVQFDHQVAFNGDHLLMVLEGSSTASMVAQVKIEINPENVAYGSIAQPWQLVYDASSSNAWEREVRSFALDPANNRTLFMFRISHLASDKRAARHIRLTRIGSAPGAEQKANVLMIASSGVFPGGCQWVISYEDAYARAESYGLEAQFSEGEKLKNVGGPATPVLTLPLLSDINYDYRLYVRNADGGDNLQGGLNGEPSHLNFYLRYPSADQALYAFTNKLYSPAIYGAPFVGKGWDRLSDAPTLEIKTDLLIGFGPHTLNPNRPAPSSFQTTVPAARCNLFANGRLFVMNVTESGGGRSRGDLYFSSDSQPFRMQSIVESELSGGRISFAGESGQALLSAAAAAQGASYVYVLTNRAFYALGGSGGFAGSGFNAQALSVAVKIAPIGSQSPRSATEYEGVLYWLDDEGYVRRFSGGSPSNLSRLAVDDRFQALPADRRDNVCGCFFKERYYMAYSSGGSSTNDRLLVWNEVLRAWESDDELLSPCTAEIAVRHFDSTVGGSGQRLLLAGSDGKVYSYEVGVNDLASSGVAVQLTSRELVSESPNSFLFDSVDLVCGGIGSSLTVDRVYRPYGSVYRSSFSLSGGWVTDESSAHSEIVAPADGGGERGFSGYLDLYGSLPGGSRLLALSTQIVPLSSKEAKSG